MHSALIACERSGRVRDAFIECGWDAWSCDIVPTEKPGPHILDDVRNVLDWGWDLMVGHPPCTYLSYAGMRWMYPGGVLDPERMRKAREAFKFFMDVWEAPIPMIALENTRGLIWKWFRKPDQVIDPSMFGHAMTKATCLWLKQLPPLMANDVVANPFVNWTKYKGSHTGVDRSRTFPGIATAMANQWGRTV